MSKPVRILHVFAQMNRGGAETMIMNLYRNIDRSKVQFDFIVHTKNKCAYDDEIHKLGGQIFRMPTYRGKNHFEYSNSWKRFFNIYSEYKIIHGHVRSTATIYLKIAKKRGLITIAHSHNTSSGDGFSACVKNVLQYPIRYVADHLFACSETAGQWLFGKSACRKNNFYILNNAIDSKKFIYNSDVRIKKRKELRLEDKFVVGHVGRFHPQKNHEFLIDIFKKVYDCNNNALLMLVGQGDLQASIEKKVNDLGLDNNVIFTGVRSDMEEIFQAMDVFVFPSLYEGLGIVLVEAQASGLSCVVADTIPDEAIVTDLVEQISLTDTSDNWVNSIVKYSYGIKRTNTFNDIKCHGYDIKESCIWLQQFYLGLVEKNEASICN